MQCEVCGVNEAHVNITTISNGVSEVHHYCQECFKKIKEENAVSMSKSFLKMMLDSISANRVNKQESEGTYPEVICPKCHKTFKKFVADKSFGCDKCYDIFETSIRNMLKTAGDESDYSEPEESEETISELELKMNEAVRSEDYTRAAILRDKIAALRKDKK